MNPDFKSRQLSFLLQNVAVTLILLGIHSYLLSHFAENTNFIIPIWQIYVFHFAVTTLLYSVINYQYSRGKTVLRSAGDDPLTDFGVPFSPPAQRLTGHVCIDLDMLLLPEDSFFVFPEKT